MQDSILCTCPKTKCPRHGDCAACEAHHGTKRHPPYCRRKSRRASEKAGSPGLGAVRNRAG